MSLLTKDCVISDFYSAKADHEQEAKRIANELGRRRSRKKEKNVVWQKRTGDCVGKWQVQAVFWKALFSYI